METGPKPVSNIFVTHGAANKDAPSDHWYKKLFRNIRFRFINFDILTFAYTVNTYIENIIRAAYILIAEHKRIKK